MALLELNAVARYFGGVKAVDGLDLKVEQGAVFGLIGPNGSGKSTTVNLITGVYGLSAGSVQFDGQDISETPIHRRLGLGISRTFQNIRLFGRLSVWQNLWVAQNSQSDQRRQRFLGRWLGGSKGAKSEIQPLLEFAGLAHKADELAANLAFGDQRKLELARALSSNPKLILLDEPAAGMNVEGIAELDRRIQAIKLRGTTVLLIEHHMELVMAVSDQIAVLNFGQKIAQGTPAQIQSDTLVKKAYLGGDEQ